MGGLGTELNLLKTQVRKNSLNIAQIVQSSPDSCHVITSARTSLSPLSFFSRREATILTELLHNKNKGIKLHEGVFSNFNTSLKSMWVNDRHKSVQNLSSVKLRPAQGIYPNISKIKTLITRLIHFHASNNSDNIMKFPPIIAKNVKNNISI